MDKKVKAVYIIGIIALLSASVTMMSMPAAASSTIYVPDDSPTIQEAIAAANEGDTIIVKEGTYSGMISINKDNLTLCSEMGPSVTIVNLGGATGPI